VHVWRADLATVGEDLAGSLSGEERERAACFVGEADRRLWSRSRGVLRGLLGRYLRKDASAVDLAAGRHGKLELAGGERPSLYFNLSHSRELALYAFAASGPVGIDVQVARRESARGGADRVALARRAFGDVEARRLDGLPPAAREHEFLRLWTRYEADAKCRGTGIGAIVGEADREPVPEAPSAAPWIVELDVGARAAAAVASEHEANELRLWEWA
jgi:4'-phosphopantetheinyl transferase